MNKSIFIILVIISSIYGCNDKNSTYKKIVYIDSLLEKRQLDSAEKVISTINITTASKSIQAYYNLLFTRLNYMQYKPFKSDSLIEQSVNYFENTKEYTKLSQAYFYKGVVLYDLGLKKEAIVSIKKSENIAIALRDEHQENIIYKHLAILNSIAGEDSIAMKYAKKSLSISQTSNNKTDLTDIYNIIAISYNGLSQKDSARYYINKCIPLFQYIPKESRVLILDNIGYLNMDSNPKLALKYLNLAMKLGPSPDTYDNLAQIYIKQGKKEKADSLWKEALRTKDISKKSEIIATILRNKQEKGDYKEIAHYASWLVDLKDSLAEQRKNEQILEQQIKFDYEVAQTEQQKTITRLTYVICIIFLLLVILCLIIKFRHIKGTTEKLENEKKLKEYKITIEQLASTGTTGQKMIADLQKRIDKLQKYKDTYTHQGNVLYESAMAGKCIKDWNKSEMTTFLDHYITKDIEYSLTLEENEQLTPREKVFLVLLHEGKAEAKIAEMMTLSNSALRTMKSRIKKKQEKR